MKNFNQHKYWRNDFLDVIYYEHPDFSTGSWIVIMNGKYITSKSGLNIAKSFVNKKRGFKTKWTKINSY